MGWILLVIVPAASIAVFMLAMLVYDRAYERAFRKRLGELGYSDHEIEKKERGW